MCKFCENFDFGKVKINTEIYSNHISAYITTAGGSSRFPIEQQFNYCPNCGMRLKDRKENCYDTDNSLL